MPLGTVYVADESPRAGAEPVFGYRLLQRLGGGGHGEVWSAEGPGGFLVALKFNRLEDGPTATDLRALEILREIRHPNLLLTFGAWEIPGYLVLGMELADRTLWDRFVEAQDEGLAGIPREELLEYLAETAKGIDHLNGARVAVDGRARLGVQHRDLKPQNILLAGGGVKVADFGLARQLDHSLASHTGNHWTFAYAAPEFFRKQTASQSDQYSLAATYCHLRGGRPPFQGPAAVIMAGHLLFPPDLAMLPPEERDVVGRALAKEPKDRWPHCRAFVEALRAVVPVAAVEGEAIARDLETPPIDPDALATRTFRPAPEATVTWTPPAPAEAPAIVPDEPPRSPEPLAVPAMIFRMERRRRWPSVVSGLAAAASLVAVVGLGLRASGLGEWAATRTAGFPPASEVAGPFHPTQLVVAEGRMPPPISPSAPEPALEQTPRVVDVKGHRVEAEDPSPPPTPPAEAPDLLPPEPSTQGNSNPLAEPPKAVASLSLQAPEALTIVAGRPATLTVRVSRGGVAGPISARVEGLPTGFLAPERVIAPGSDEAALRVTVPADAPACEFSARVVAAAEGSVAESSVKVAVEPSRASVSLRKARALLERGQPVEALAALDGAIAEDPEDAASYALRGMVQTRAGAFEKAIADFGEALKRRPHDASTFNNRGLARRGLGEYHRAIADYDEALRLNPRDAVVHFNRGMAYRHLGDDTGAVSDFTRAIELDPEHAPSYRARGEILATLGAPKRSKADLDAAKRLEAVPPKGAPTRVVPGNLRPSAPKRATASAGPAIVAARPE